MNPRDEQGWRVPRPGTKSAQIYDLLLAGFSTGEIIELFQENPSHASVAVLIFNIKHPKAQNKFAQKWRNNNPVAAKAIASRSPNKKPTRYSKYVRKLVTVLGISYIEAVELERKELEKLK